jgi:transposase
MMAERLKTSLKVSDEEWGVIQPLIEKVQAKQRDAMSSRFGGFGGGRGPGGGNTTGGNAPTAGATSDPSRPERAGTAEREALRTALENESTSPETIKAKLAAVREVHKKSAAELAAAREELQKVLTVRQEATLVSYGILE